uniref:Uncharacterized protein n=1 Tax=Magallana gigas TaxID=29159 RepID=K1S326_MAGGI
MSENVLKFSGNTMYELSHVFWKNWKNNQFALHANTAEQQNNNAFKHLPKETIRAIAKEMNEKINDAVEMAERMSKIKEPIREDMTPDPEIMKESGFLMEDSAELSDLLNSLPPLKKEDMHFLHTCVARAEETDFNEFTDRRSLMNEVLRQVFTCTAIGLNLMESETYLDDLTDEELTIDEFVHRFQKIQQMSIEFLHLGGFVFQFSRRIESHFGTVSNNELVLGGAGEPNKNDPYGTTVTNDPYVHHTSKDGGVEVGDGKPESNEGHTSKTDVKLDEAVNELKRLFGSKKITGLKDKVKSKITNLIGGGKDKGAGKDSTEKTKRPDNKPEADKKDEQGKFSLLKNKLKNLLSDFSDDKRNISPENGKTPAEVDSKEKKVQDADQSDMTGKGQSSDREVLFQLLSKRRQILKRENKLD